MSRYNYHCVRCNTDLVCEFPIGKAHEFIKCRVCRGQMRKTIDGVELHFKGGGWTTTTA